MRALRAVDRSDVVLVVLNAEEGIREQDKKKSPAMPTKQGGDHPRGQQVGPGARQG